MAGVPSKKGTPVTQAVLNILKSGQSVPTVSQTAIQVTYRPPVSPSGRVTQEGLLVAHRPRASTGVRVSQSALNVLWKTEVNVMAKVTQAAILIAWKTGTEGVGRQRAWPFPFDGHKFYVLDLGEEGTWLYDFTSQQWSKAETTGYNRWNFINGYYWESQAEVVGFDIIYSTIYKLDPKSHLDEGWRPITYKVTAGVSSRDRDGRSVDSVRLACSAGYMTDPLPTISMKFSDDNGGTWSQDYPFQLKKGIYNQRVEWNSLGQISIPGRVFEFSDEGGLIRIDGAEVQIDGQK